MAIPDRRVSPWGFVGIAGMVSVLFLYGASGLVAPPWAVVVLLLVWLAMFVQTCRWFVPYPSRTVAMPVIALVIWFAAISAGGVFLDWSA
jgi:hypothetical protein